MIKTPMMLLLSGEEANDERYMQFAIEDIAKAGFDGICLEFRSSNYNEHDAIGKKAIQFVQDKSKENGMGFVIIVPHCSKWILQKYPYLRRKICKEYSFIASKREGRIVIPKIEGRKPQKVISAFAVKKADNGDIIQIENITKTAEFSFKRGELFAKNCPDGEIFVYVQYTMEEADYAHRKAELILDEYMSIYKNYSVDGYAMDEFGAGARMENAYLCGEDFLKKFKARFGYDFLDKLYLMNHSTGDESFAKVRYDYYSLTNDTTLAYQLQVRKRFEELFGKDLFIGFHHTWFGEGNSGDLWSGAINYFEQSQSLSGGFVDAQYDAERTMTSLGLLAESIAKYNPTGMAYNMCWDRYPTPDKMDYFHRFLAVRNQNWVDFGYSKTLNDADEFFWHVYDFDNSRYLFGDVLKCIQRERVFSQFIGNLQSKPKIAITYNWEANAYYNNDYMHYHRLSLKALADKLVLNNIPADIVPSYETNFDQYEVIFVLWATMMRKEQWVAIKQAITEGKKVYFIGPPARITTDGEDISKEFEAVVGTKIVDVGEFMGGHEYVAWDLWFTEKRVHMKVYRDENRLMDFINGNVKYYGYELPLTDAFFNVLEELKPYQTVDSNKVITKEYHSNNEQILTITARWQSKINEKLCFKGKNIEIKNGLLVGIKIKDGELEIISEPNAEIFVEGKAFEYRVI